MAQQSRACPVCGSTDTRYMRDVPTRRTKRNIPLYHCATCESFWNPSGYREDEAQLAKDLEWGLSVQDRNRHAARRLFDRLKQEGVVPKSIADIGCGIGTMLEVAEGLGMKAIGFDVNQRAIDHAVRVGLNARQGYWSSETITPKIDLYLCISVLEHIEEPRPLIRELCKAALAHGAALFISVPFLDRDRWSFLEDPDPMRPRTPFFDNDVHVTHFSTKGLVKAMEEFGAWPAKPVKAGLWDGVLYAGAGG